MKPLYFYILHIENQNPRTVLKHEQYVHIKAHRNGKQIAIISGNEIIHEKVEEKTIEELQGILDQWIDEENAEGEEDINGQPIIQSKIDLKSWLAHG